MSSVSHMVVEGLGCDPLFFPTLLQIIEVCSIGLCTALLRSHHSILVSLRSGLWLNHCNTLILFFFRHSVVDLLLCLGSLSCWWASFSFSCRTDGLTFDSRILWYPEEFMVDSMTARCPGPVAAEQAQMISPPPPCLTVGMRCLCWYAAFGFLQTCCCALWPNISTLVWSVQRTLFQKSSEITNLSCAAMFFLERRGFLLQPFQTSHTWSVFF